MSISPQAGAVGVLNLTIKVAGTTISDTVRTVSVQISIGVNRNSTADIVVLDGDMPVQTWPVLDSKIFDPGNEIQICAGYGGHTDVIFEGVIVKQSTRISGDDGSILSYNCLSRENSINSKRTVDSPAYNFTPVLNITYGEDLMEFNAEFDSELSPMALDTRKGLDLHDPKTKSARIKGRLLFQGCAKVLPGATITLAGVGKRYEGLVFVDSVKHEIKEGDWLTEVEFWRPDSLV